MESYEYVDDSDLVNFEKLRNRGKYLTEVIDKISNKSTLDDINKIHPGRTVVTWGPSSGKTTAMRQFIVKNYRSTNGVIATKLVDDVDRLYYDIVAQITYLTNSLTSWGHNIVKFHSNSNISLTDLRRSKWIVCTHERLLIEPPSIIYMMDLSTVGYVVPTEALYRQYLFIDEYPSNLFKSCRIKDLMALRLLDYEAKTNDNVSTEPLDDFHKTLLRTSYISDLYDSSPGNKPYLINMLDNLPAPTNYNNSIYSIDLKLDRERRSEFNKTRLSFYSDFFLRKLDEYESTHDEELDIASNNDKIYYTINDLLIPNIYLFDGTGDILFKNSTTWNMSNDPRFNRKLSLKSATTLKTKVKRTDSRDVVIKEYSYFINEITKTNPDSKILVYLWKNTKNDTEELSSVLINYLDNPERVSFIHYQSGNERVTSKYIDHDVVVILGKFFIPNDAISLINYITNSKITTSDYTKSLLIQFIYRSSARLNKEIKLYYTSDYSREFINDTLDKMNSNKVEFNKLYSNIEYDYSKSKIYKNIINSENKIDYDDYIIINSSELVKLLGFSRNNNDHIKSKLDSESIKYEYIRLSYKVSQYKIYKIK